MPSSRRSTARRSSASPEQVRSSHAGRDDGSSASARSTTGDLRPRRDRSRRAAPRPPARAARRSPVQLLVQPPTRLDPVALHGPLRDSERLPGLLRREPAEVPAHHHLAQPPVQLGESVQRFVQREQRVAAGRGRRILGQRHVVQLAPSPGRLAASGVVHQDPAHRQRRGAEEVRPVAPFDPGLIHQPQVGLVHQARGAEGVTGPLASKLGVGEPAKVGIDLLVQPGLGVRVAVAEPEEQLGDATPVTGGSRERPGTSRM